MNFKNQKAFTLLEIIIVIIIIGVLTSLALPRLFRMVRRAKAAEAFSAIASLRSSIERYYLMHDGSYAGMNLRTDIRTNNLDIEDPGTAPGANFGYIVAVAGPLNDRYYMIANESINGATTSHIIVCAYQISYGWLADPETGEAGNCSAGANEFKCCGNGVFKGL